MCKDCRDEIKNDLLGLLAGEDNRLSQSVDDHVPGALKAVNARIDAVIEAKPEVERPDEDEVREAVRDCLVAAVLATGAAMIAKNTPGYTDEGGQDAAMILGTWAGCVLENEMQDIEQNLRKHLLGMGDN